MRYFVVVIGLVLALFVAFGRALFSVLGANTVWYALGLSLPYLLLSLLLAWRLTVTRRNQRPTTRAVWVLAALSWLNALAFAVTVPDVQADGSLASIIAPPGASAFAVEMSVALCNPFIILAFLFLGLSCAAAWLNSRPPYAEPDLDFPANTVE